MDMRKRLFYSVSALLISFSVFLSTSVLRAEAVEPPVQTYTLTAAQTRALFGDTITATYIGQGDASTNGTPVQKTATFEYNSTDSYSSSRFTYYSSDALTYAGREIVWYRAHIDDLVEQNTFNVQFKTSLDLEDLTYIDTALTFDRRGWDPTAVPYGTYPWNWYYSVNGSGSEAVPLRQDASGTLGYGYYGYFYYSLSGGYGTTYDPIIPIFYSGSAADISFGWAEVSPTSNYNDNVDIGIVCPIISTYSYGGNNGAGQRPENSSGSGSGSNSGSGDASQIVAALDRMSEQQSQNLSESGPLSWIGSKIANLVGGIVDGIKGLFIPPDGTIEAFKNSLDSKFHETFGAMYDGDTLLRSALNNLNTTTGLESITFPGIEVPLHDASTGEDVTFELEPATVPLKPQYNAFTFEDNQFPNLYECVAIAVDFVAVLLFVNMLRNKLETILTGREVHDE